MGEALRLAVANVKRGGGPFGAVIVKNGKIIARGWNQVTLKNDPTAHAEVAAIRDACRKLKNFQLTGCDLYTSCEPCPMCLSAIYWARPKNVYYLNTRREAAAIGFDDEFIYEEIKKAIPKRKYKMKRIISAGALKAFDAWKNKRNKIRY